MYEVLQMRYKDSRFCENMNYPQFETEGKFDTPILKPHQYVPTEFVGFNYARTSKNKSEKGIHFFLDDYQFERVWREPMAYIDLLAQYQCVMTPDFSLYMDYPKALQIYNHWRKHWLGALWQAFGISVIPTIAWSDKDSYKWCFDGIPKNSTIAVSSVGTQNNKQSKTAFLDGWFECVDRLAPETIIFYGTIPEECNGNIVRIKAFQEKFKEVKTDGR